MDDPEFERIVNRDLKDGQHRNPTSRPDYFTTAFFHRPDQLAREIEAADLTLQDVYGIEGPGWILSDIADRMANPRQRSTLLRVAQLLEREPAVAGISAHLLAVAQRPR
jgi:hypothetical protein